MRNQNHIYGTSKYKWHGPTWNNKVKFKHINAFLCKIVVVQ